MKGALVIHGLTGTPVSVAPVVEVLVKSGFTAIEAPLLAGHGTSVEALKDTKLEEWYASVKAAYKRLDSRADQIYCAGLSLGSLLAVKLALENGTNIKKLACLGTPLRLSSMFERFFLPMSHIPPFKQFMKYSKKSWEESVLDEVGREIHKNSSYDKTPITSVWELQRLQKEIIAGLKNLTTPTILIHSIRDKVAPVSNVDLFCKLAKRIKPTVVLLERSEHVITLDLEKEIVLKNVADFFLSI